MQDMLSLLDPSRPDERCGFLMTDGTIVEVKNVHTEPELGFRMDPHELLEHVSNAIATWHTHPKTTPNLSQEDYAGFLAWPKLTHYIIGHGEAGPEVREYVVDDGVVVQQ